MNVAHEQFSESRTQMCQQEVTAAYGDVSLTTRRFSLINPGVEEKFAYDLLLSAPDQNGFNRILAADKQDFNQEVFDAIDQLPDVAQLPIVGQSNNVVAFGVPDGMKPLSRERMHSRESSGTYIGDAEVMAQLGFMYGRIWKGTGLLVENPYDHAGIVNFEDDNQRYMFLVPPYNTQSTELFQEAYKAFAQSIHKHFSHNQALRGLPTQRNSIDNTLLAAQDGFRMGAF